MFNALSLRQLKDGRLFNECMELFFKDEFSAQSYAIINGFSGILIW